MNMAACRRRKERTPMLLIQNAHLIDPASRTDGIRDILTTGEKIIKIAEHIAPEEASGLTILDAKGLTAIPGPCGRPRTFPGSGLYLEGGH